MSVRVIYKGSDGREHDIAAMGYHHLRNARRKLEGAPIMGGDATANQRMAEISARNRLVDAMKAEEARRNVAYAATVPTLPTVELHRAWQEMNAAGRRQEPDWTPERQAVYEAVELALAQRRQAH